MFRILIVLIVVPLLSACNTIEGIGKDVKKGGEAIQKSVK